MKEWSKEGVRVHLDCGIFRLEERDFVSPRTGLTKGYWSLSGADWVNVIALTADEEVVLIRQFRHSRETVTIEIPGGLVDPGETPLQAGMRELLEETGYGGDGARVIGVVEPNPAILDNLCHTVFVTGVTPKAQPRLEDSEDIDTFLVPLASVPAMISDGKIKHALVIAAFSWLWLSRHGSSCPDCLAGKLG